MIKSLILITFYLYSAFIYTLICTDLIAEAKLITGSEVDGFVLMISILAILFFIPIILSLLLVLTCIVVYKIRKRELKFQNFKNYFFEFGNNKFLAAFRIINLLIVIWQTVVLKLWHLPGMLFAILHEFITNIL
mgnify:CR=1 FL=1